MRTLTWVFIVAGLLLVSVGTVSRVGPQLHSTAYADDGACPPNPSPPDAADPSIIVDTPVPGQRVTSPVLISGRARVFEAVVSITIAQGGKPLVETTTMAAEGQVLSAFSTQVAFALAGGVSEAAGCIRVYEASARDGSPVNVVQIPVTLATGPVPPSTGNGGLVDEASGGQSVATAAIAAACILVLLSLPVVRRRGTRDAE